MNERLAPVFRPAHGRRLCVLYGAALEDLFYLSDEHGARRATEALWHLAVEAGVDVAMSVGVDGRAAFAKRDMQSVFEELTRAVTTPRPGDSAREPFRPGQRATEEANTSTQVGQVEQRANDPLRNQLGRIERALSSSRRILAVVQYPEDLWVGAPSPSTVDTLRALGHAARGTEGNPDSAVVLLVKPQRREDFLNHLDQVSATEQFRRAFDLGPPGRAEIEAFLTRFVLRNNLHGSRAHVVSEALARRWLLHHLHEALRRVLGIPEEERRVERALDTGDRAESPEVVLAELDKLVGLAPIKEQLRRFAAIARQQQEDIRQGRAVQPLNTHMLFLGNPGTGKTEVARLVGRYLRAIGLRTGGAFVEISRTDLASEFNPGECIRRMREAIDRAVGGVLFVDEAYQLASDEWMEGALETLMKDMEDRRGSMTVIFAGYEDRMQELWGVNPGFRSRILDPNWFRFPDYSVEELTEIWRRMCESRHLQVPPEATAAAGKYIGAGGEARSVRQRQGRPQLGRPGGAGVRPAGHAGCDRGVPCRPWLAMTPTGFQSCCGRCAPTWSGSRISISTSRLSRDGRDRRNNKANHSRASFTAGSSGRPGPERPPPR
jgi:hypothetical protein